MLEIHVLNLSQLQSILEMAGPERWVQNFAAASQLPPN
jgi:hypothetical protein